MTPKERRLLIAILGASVIMSVSTVVAAVSILEYIWSVL